MLDTNAVRLAAEQGARVTPDQFKTGLAEVRAEIANLGTRLSTQIAELRTELHTKIASVRTDIASVRTEIAGSRTEMANLETRLIRWMVGTVMATAALTFGVLRFLAG